jgi:signal transduction histidine kinase
LAVAAGHAVITVRDHGGGIPPEDQQRIFAPFERVGTNTVRDGLGLGLYIARQLAEAHGGTLDVESSEGDGAVFVLRLPSADTGGPVLVA